MEKITKEELLEMLDGVTLSDDMLEKIAGGYPEYLSACLKNCESRFKREKVKMECIKHCFDNDF